MGQEMLGFKRSFKHTDHFAIGEMVSVFKFSDHYLSRKEEIIGNSNSGCAKSWVCEVPGRIAS